MGCSGVGRIRVGCSVVGQIGVGCSGVGQIGVGPRLSMVHIPSCWQSNPLGQGLQRFLGTVKESELSN